VPTVSAIVLCWNGADFVGPCLAALRVQTLRECEIIVVDNASTDGTAELVARSHPDLPLIRNERNLGFAGGMNRGIAQASAPLLVLLNQDVVLEPDALAQLAAAFAEDARVGAVGAKLLFPDRLRLQHAGGYLEWPLALGQHYGHGTFDLGQFDQPREVEYVTGAVMGLRRTALEEVGLLDERFWPGYFEEVDLCHRLRAAGWRVVYRPEVRAIHHESTTLGRLSEQYYVAYHRGRLRYVLKHSDERAFRTFAAAEAARFPTLASWREQRALTTVYRELSSEVARERPTLLPYYRQLLRLEPPRSPQRLPGLRRLFHPARARDFQQGLDPLRQGWRVVGPPIVPPERRPLPLLLGLLRTASWLVIRWSFLPVLEQQDRYNQAVLATFERWASEYEVLLERLTHLIRTLESALEGVDERAQRLEPRVDLLELDLVALETALGELVVRSQNDFTDEAIAAIDRDLTRLRREVALVQARLARAEQARQVNGRAGELPASEAV
jgi:GT2 family glycosyltransferase